MKFINTVLVLASTVLLLASCDPTEEVKIPKATHLYFSDYSGKRVGVIDLESPGAFTTLADESDGLDTVAGIAVDFKNGKIYVVEERANKIKRFNIEGGGLEVLYDETDGVDMPTSIAVDENAGTIYWANSGSGHIMKGNITGTSAIDTLYDVDERIIDYCYGLVVDTKGKQLYFSDLGEFGGIWRGMLDGSSYPILLFSRSALSTTLLNPSGIFLDRNNSKIYWADEGLDVITMAYMVTGAPAPSALFNSEDGINRADGVAVDNGNQKIYWSETGNNGHAIFRGNLDGTEGREVVLDDVESYCIVLKFDNQ